jgi:hypothetical protein
MTYYIMADGTIKYASDMVGELLKMNGGRKLELKPIELNTKTNEGSRSIGTGEVPKSRKRRNNRRSEGKIYSTMDKK